MTTKEIKSALKGAKVSYYDSWNGSSESYIIDHVTKVTTSSFVVYDENGKDHYIPTDIIETLVSTGEATRYNEVDHCSVREDYKLTKAEQPKQTEQQPEPEKKIDIFDHLSQQTLSKLLAAFVDADKELGEEFSLEQLACKTDGDYSNFWIVKTKVFNQICKNDKNAG